MSQNNVEIVRSIYESVKCGDWGAAFGLQHPDFEVTIQRAQRRVLRKRRSGRKPDKAPEAAGILE